MSVERGFRAKFRYRADEFMAGGASRQLLFLFGCVILLVVVHGAISLLIGLPNGETVLDHAWFYFARLLDAGTMGGDEGNLNRFISTSATIMGVIVAGLLISSLAGNFQERLDDIRRGGSAVMEENHFLILGWSEKIYSVIDQITEAYLAEKKKHIILVMAEQDKIEMESKLRDKVQHLDRVKLVVRSGSSVNLNDLSRVSFEKARGIVILIEEADASDPNKADGRIIKSLLAIYNHPDTKNTQPKFRATAEVMLAENQDIAVIASGGRAQVVKTNEIISKIILQTSRISGLSFIYDELLRFEGSEIQYKFFPQAVGRRFGEIILDFPAGCPIGIAKRDGSAHQLNPALDHVVQPDEEILVVAEDASVAMQPYSGPIRLSDIRIPSTPATKPVEHMLVLGWNEKIFPIVEEFDNYVGKGSTLTLVNSMDVDERKKLLAENCDSAGNADVRHVTGEFTSREFMDKIVPQNYPNVMVLGDQSSGSVEEADTKAIIALLLLRDFRRRSGIQYQKVCSEILDPKNRELAATTEIHDIVISNEMVSMVLAQITYEPRVRAVLEDLFQSEGSEVYLKDVSLYVQPGVATTYEYLMLAAKVRGEVAFGIQIYENNPANRYGISINPNAQLRRTPFMPKQGDRLIVLAEDDG